MAKYRMQKINAEMQKCISEVISFKMNNAELEGSFITVSKVDTTSDLFQAKVYISILPSKEYTKDQIFAIINNARGFIRHEVTQMINLRISPELIFVLDDSLDYGQKINKILDSIAKEDADNE